MKKIDEIIPELPSEDWIIDRVSCNKGEKVKITVTNLDDTKPIYFKSTPGYPYVIWKEGEGIPFETMVDEKGKPSKATEKNIEESGIKKRIWPKPPRKSSR